MAKNKNSNPNQLVLDLFRDTQTNTPIIHDEPVFINIELDTTEGWEFNEDWGEWFNDITGESMSVAAWETANNNHF